MRSIYELLPNEIKEQGYTQEVISKLYNQLYIKKNIEVHVEMVLDAPMQVMTLQGLVMAMIGMYVVTGARGEKYVITPETLEMTYDKVYNKPNVYVKKKYPVIAEKKAKDFLVPNNDANGGFLKGRAGGYLVQSMIYSKSIYPVDREIFEESYVSYVEYLRDKYGVADEIFLEEMQDLENREVNIFQKIIEGIRGIWYKVWSKFSRE